MKNPPGIASLEVNKFPMFLWFLSFKREALREGYCISKTGFSRLQGNGFLKH
jgi:hypothetical protein